MTIIAPVRLHFMYKVLNMVEIHKIKSKPTYLYMSHEKEKENNIMKYMWRTRPNIYIFKIILLYILVKYIIYRYDRT